MGRRPEEGWQTLQLQHSDIPRLSETASSWICRGVVGREWGRGGSEGGREGSEGGRDRKRMWEQETQRKRKRSGLNLEVASGGGSIISMYACACVHQHQGGKSRLRGSAPAPQNEPLRTKRGGEKRKEMEGSG